jgi:hypothetical protein
MLVFQEAVLMILVLESRGAAGHANSSNNALVLPVTLIRPTMPWHLSGQPYQTLP